MNPGRSVPAQLPPNPSGETTRQFVSDLDVRILADAYGYSVVLPSTLNTAHATLDSLTGTLLVQGGVNAAGQGQNETIQIDTVGSDIRARVTNNATGVTATKLVPSNHVTQIVIARNGGNDTLAIDAAFASFVKEVNYVVSSNQDSAAAGTVGDGLVDLSAVIPGNQVALRAAIVDANGTAGGAARGIYIPRGNYRLALTGNNENAAATGDLDVTRAVTIIGTGAGSAVIDGGGVSGPQDRLFDVQSAGVLNLSRVTLTGGRARNANGEHGGAIIVREGGELNLSYSAVVGNATTHAIGSGGGLYFFPTGKGTISDSVITANHSTGYTGGVFLDRFGTNPSGVVTMTRTVVAKNTAFQSVGPDVLARSANPATLSRTFTSGGNNRLTSGATGFTNGVNGDYINANVNFIVTSVADTLIGADDAYARSLREAVNSANVTAEAQEIWVPGWHFLLTLGGTGAVAQGDLDISNTGAATIRGVGAGSTVIDASGLVTVVAGVLTAAPDRIFEVENGATLNLSNATLTGGGGAGPGAIVVRGGGQLNLDRAALVNNHATGGAGGAINIVNGGGAAISNSVITGNSGTFGGGIFVNELAGVVSLANTVVANNTATNGGNDGDDLFSKTVGGNVGEFTSLWNNRITNLIATVGITNGVNGDYMGAADYVVTSIVDTFSDADNAYSLSVREAINLANTNPGDEIWLPAWTFFLTIARPTTALTDTDVAFGDLDIHQSLTLRGIAGPTSVEWRAGAVADAVFDLIGDYNGDGITSQDDGSVTSADYTVWADTLGSTTDLRADGDDNGIVQQADWDIWMNHFGNTLTRFGV